MKITTLFFALFSSMALCAQQAYPDGAIWHYQYFSAFQFDWIQISGHEILSEAGMTSINGQSYQVIQRQRVEWEISTLGNPSAQWEGPSIVQQADLYIRKEGDIEYYMHDGEEHILFDYGAEIGENWESHAINSQAGWSEVYISQVADKGEVLINGELKRFIDIEGVHNGYSTGLVGRAIEGLGFIGQEIGFLVPDYTTVLGAQGLSETEWFRFNCFQSSSDPLYMVQDYCASSPLSTTEGEDVQVNIFPNPTSSAVTIEIPMKESLLLELRDISGRLIQSMDITENLLHVDLTACHSGIYFVTLKTTEGQVVHHSPLIRE